MGRSKEAVLGIDIGGTKIRGVLGSKFWEFDTPRTKKEFISILKKFPRANKVDIAVAGVVSGTRVKISPNIKYLKNFDFSAVGGPAFGGKVHVDNDARSFLSAKIVRYRVSNRILGITVGTGIGRAFAEKGKVKKIKILEYPESWEGEYQKIRDKKDYKKLAEFLGEKFSVLIKKYKPDAIILGGGVMNKKGFYKMLKARLKIKTYA